MKKGFGSLTTWCVLLLVGGVVLAQGRPEVNRSVIGGGGGTATGGDISLRSALGQAAAGPSSGGDVTISAGFWTGSLSKVEHYVFLPVLVKDFIRYAAPCSPANDYCEDFDQSTSAYGPLQPNTSYVAYPEDGNDYYSFVLYAADSIVINVTNYQAVGQVLLRNVALEEEDKDERRAGEDHSMQISIAHLPAGKYYIQLYTAPGHRHSDALYTLVVSQ